MSFLKSLLYADIRLRGYIFNLMPDRGRRRAFRGRVVSRDIDCYSRRMLLDDVARMEETPAVRNDGGERIFTLWLQGEDAAPPLVKACFRSVRHHCTQPLVVLDERTLGDWIELPDAIVEKFRRGKIRAANFSDIVRAELLYRHGGYWMDATCFVTAPIPAEITAADFFLFMAGGIDPENAIQSCFIRARKGDYLLAAWRKMMIDYWTRENGAFNYFMFHYMFQTLVRHDPRAAEHFARMPRVEQDPTHLLWWSDAPERKFDRELFERMTADTFFQKTTYRSRYGKEPPAGSLAEEMIHRMYI